MNEEVGKLIGLQIGTDVVVDTTTIRGGWGRYLRIDHTIRAYTTMMEQKDNGLGVVMNYGPWLRASTVSTLPSCGNARPAELLIPFRGNVRDDEHSIPVEGSRHPNDHHLTRHNRT
ncbi:hypothetical protein TorRG33x02_087850 [Trema orientale]|uniref:Uncharacterized protein n=1 Tax=Trema orientale TaxID=63057 RepID=A0A2P5FBV4_TREOI|nr:hypothetical protein TorRG33x02_087850 [Trema orientale]